MGVNKETDGNDSEIDLDVLEKGLNDSLEALHQLIPLSKAKKEEDDYDEEESAEGESEEEDDEESEEDEKEEPEHKSKMHKSLPDMISEDDPEAGLAMDVSPFLKSFAKSVQGYIDQGFSNLQKSVSRVEDLAKAQGKAYLASAELSKAMSGKIQQIADTPSPSSSVLTKSGSRFAAPAQDPADYEPASVLAKSFDLLSKGKIDTVMATKIEHRVNRRLPLPEEVAALFADKQ